MDEKDKLIAEMLEALELAARVLSDLPSTSTEGTRTRAAWLKATEVIAKVRQQ